MMMKLTSKISDTVYQASFVNIERKPHALQDLSTNFKNSQFRDKLAISL